MLEKEIAWHAPVNGTVLYLLENGSEKETACYLLEKRISWYLLENWIGERLLKDELVKKNSWDLMGKEGEKLLWRNVNACCGLENGSACCLMGRVTQWCPSLPAPSPRPQEAWTPEKGCGI